jgi:LacI family transcriptional regulator
MDVEQGLDSPVAPRTAQHVTLTEVAAAAGVSLATASKALNGRSDVNEGTRSRVMKAAAELGFTPNALARGLMDGRTHTVGIVTDDLTGRFVPQIMNGAELALGLERSTVLLANSTGDPEREERQVRALLSRRVDGLLIVHEFMTTRAPIKHAGRVPTVYVFGRSEREEDVSVIPDVEHGGRLATDHLIGLGRREIFHLGGPKGEYPAEHRAEGTRQALRSAGMPHAGDRIQFGQWHEKWGWDAVGRLLTAGRQLDGIVAGNDQIARGAIDRLHAAGKRVPEDVAVVGYDNWDVLARDGRTPITSVDMRLDKLGTVAVGLLYQERPVGSRLELVQGELVVRESTVRP